MAFELHPLSLPSLELNLLSYGLTFHSLVVKLPTSSTERDLLIGYNTPQEHGATRGFRNQTVGRYANRLPVPCPGFGGKGGGKLELKANEGDAVCLHGGSGIDQETWLPIERSSSHLFPISSSDYPPQGGEESIFRIVSPAGKDGFPCELEIEGLVMVRQEADSIKDEGLLGRVTVVLRAKIVDDGSEVSKIGTPINLTVHWGFMLDQVAGDIKAHKMWIDSSKVTALDSNMLATGDIVQTKQGDPLNFEQGTFDNVASHRTIGDNFPLNGIDDNIIFNTVTKSSPRVVLTSSDEKISLTFFSNQSSVQCYTASGFDINSGTKKSHHQEFKEDKKGYEKFGAVFLEFHHPLAAFLHPKLEEAAGTNTILKAGEVYENFVEVEIRARK